MPQQEIGTVTLILGGHEFRLTERAARDIAIGLLRQAPPPNAAIEAKYPWLSRLIMPRELRHMMIEMCAL